MATKPKNKELEEALRKIQKQEEEIARLTDQWKRALADYQNLEKRIEQNRKEQALFASQRIIENMLPALDTLRLAAVHSQDQGLRLTLDAFEKLLRDEGIEQIETNGKQFDPHSMECVATGEGVSGMVITEVRIGYKRGDRIVRPAQVKVAILHDSEEASKNIKEDRKESA